MRTIRKYIKMLLAIFVIVPLIGASTTYALGNKTLDDIKIDASNYNQYREQLELEANKDIAIDRTMSKSYKFGKYAKTQIDGWNVEVISAGLDNDGFHTIKFIAKEGYNLPVVNPKGDTRFAMTSISYVEKRSYTIENNVGILKFKTQANAPLDTITNYVAPRPVYVRLVAVPEGTPDNQYLNDYVFVEVEHMGIDFNNTQVYTGITPIVEGSRTYLVKKNEPFKVYYMNQEHMKPIETQPSTTGVSFDHNDYKNRYRIIEGSKTDTTNKVLAYDTTIFNVFVYSYTKGTWVRLNSYDFYHADNTFKMPDINNENITFPGMKVISFSVQELIYKPHMANDPVWNKKTVGLDYTYSTKASDYNVQWTSTGVDGGSDQYRNSSLRHRFGDIYITPGYQYEYTVRFLDYDGTVIDSQKVLKGEDAKAPNDPTRENYTFEGWDKSYTNIQGDLDIHATYKEIEKPIEPDETKVKVTFIDHDGTILKEESLDKGKNATAPTSPLRAGYKFVGWDKTFVNVQEDLIVKALYKVEDVVVLPEEPETPNIPTPPTITGPEEPAPEVTPTPENPAVNEVPVVRDNNDQTVIEDQDVPQGNGDTVIKDNQTPLAKIDSAWALINLICVILTMIVGIILILSKHKEEDRKDKEAYRSEYERIEYRRRRWTKYFSVLVTLVSIIVFILTEDMTLPMQLIDKYTLVMVVILIIQFAVLIIGRKFKKEENENIQINHG